MQLPVADIRVWRSQAVAGPAQAAAPTAHTRLTDYAPSLRSLSGRPL